MSNLWSNYTFCSIHCIILLACSFLMIPCEFKTSPKLLKKFTHPEPISSYSLYENPFVNFFLTCHWRLPQNICCNSLCFVLDLYNHSSEVCLPFFSPGRGIYILYEDVKSCQYEDVHVLWSILVDSDTPSLLSKQWRPTHAQSSQKTERCPLMYIRYLSCFIIFWKDFCFCSLFIEFSVIWAIYIHIRA